MGLAESKPQCDNTNAIRCEKRNAMRKAQCNEENAISKRYTKNVTLIVVHRLDNRHRQPRPDFCSRIQGLDRHKPCPDAILTPWENPNDVSGHLQACSSSDSGKFGSPEI